MKKNILSIIGLFAGVIGANAQCLPDITAPVALCQDVTVYLDGSGNTSVLATDVDAGSSDLCLLSSVEFIKPVKLVFTTTQSDQIWSVDPDGSNPVVIYNNVAGGSAGPVGIKYEPTTDRFYYGGGNYNQNWAGSVDGSTPLFELMNASGVANEHHDLDIDAANGRYFFTTGNGGVYVANLDGSGVATNLYDNSSGNVVSVAYDPNTQKVYCSNPNTDEIHMMDDDGGNLVLLYDGSDGVSGCRQLELDENTNTLWWVNRDTDEIMEGSLDGSVTPFSLWSGYSGIYGIEFEPNSNQLYWTSFDSQDKIFSGSADGIGTASLVLSGSFGSIRDVAFAAPASSVPFLDYACSNLGPNSVTLLATDGAGNTNFCTATVTVLDIIPPTANCQDATVYVDGWGNASVQQDLVYYSSVNDDEIWSVSQDGSNPTLVVANAGQDVIGIDYNSNTLYYATGNGSNIASASAFDGSNVTVMPNSGPNSSAYHEVVIDQPNNRYFYTVSNDGVFVASLDGLGTPTQLATSSSAITGLDYDATGDKLYYTDQSDEIYRMNADGTGNTVLYDSGDGVDTPRQIVLDTAGNRLWITNSGSAEILEGSMDGLSTLTTLYSGQNSPFGIDYDPVADMLYWTRNSGTLSKAPADGTGTPLVIVSGFSGIRGVNAVSSAGPYVVDDGSSDNCSGLSYSLTGPTFSCDDIGGGATLVTLTVTDASGNTADCVSSITVADTIAPSITCLADINIVANTNVCEAVVTWAEPANNDNCGNVALTSTHSSGDNFPVGTTTVTYTATDDSGNSRQCSFDVIVTNDLSATTTSTDVSCFGGDDGAIDLTVTGGEYPFDFDWNNDGTGDYNDDEDIADLTSGSYDVVVKDNNGCTFNLSVTINELSASVVTVSLNTLTDPTCGANDGSINIDVVGGSPGYVYDWDNDGTGDNDDTQDQTGVLGVGTFTVVATDQLGCTDTVSFTTVNAAAAVLSETHVDVTCFGDADGSIDLSLAGGSPGFTYDWDNDGTGDNDDTQDLTGLSGGTYSVIVTDLSNCTSVMTVTVIEPDELLLVPYVTNEILGNDGEIDLVVIGGTPVYTFDWDNDGTGDFDDTEDLTGLAPGTFVVVVIDGNGCTNTTTVSLVNVAGIDEIGNAFNVYPNPTSGIVNIQFAELPVNTTLKLRSVEGRLIQTVGLTSATHSFDLNGFAKGIYVLEIVSEGVSTPVKIIVQ